MHLMTKKQTVKTERYQKHHLNGLRKKHIKFISDRIALCTERERIVEKAFGGV